MLLGLLLLLLPALSSAAAAGHAAAGLLDKRCDAIAAVAAPITMTSILPTQTLGPKDPQETVCSMTYTTVLPTLGPGPRPGSAHGLSPCTYTLTYGCKGTYDSPCHLPDSDDIVPPGCVRTTTVCDECGISPVTYTLTVPDPSPTPYGGVDHASVPLGENRHCGGSHPCPAEGGARPGGGDGEANPSPPRVTAVDSSGSRISGVSDSGSSNKQNSRPVADDGEPEEHFETSTGTNIKDSRWLRSASGALVAMALVVATTCMFFL